MTATCSAQVCPSVACACVMCMYTHLMTEPVAHENSFVHSNRLNHECFCTYVHCRDAHVIKEVKEKRHQSVKYH